jgi:hypothetical protein
MAQPAPSWPLAHADQLSTELDTLSLNDLDDARKLSINRALQHFRATVLQHNLVILRILIEDDEKQIEPGLEDYFDNKDIRENRLAVFRRDYYIPIKSLSRPLYLPQDLLADDLRAELIALSSLDSVDSDSVNEADNAQWITEI